MYSWTPGAVVLTVILRPEAGSASTAMRPRPRPPAGMAPPCRQKQWSYPGSPPPSASSSCFPTGFAAVKSKGVLATGTMPVGIKVASAEWRRWECWVRNVAVSHTYSGSDGNSQGMIDGSIVPQQHLQYAPAVT